MTADIQLTDLSLDLQDRPVLRLPAIAMQGRRIGIVGRNGSGKTTLARVLCGLIEADKGEVLIDGVNVAKDRAKALGLVGILFQNPDQQIIFPTVSEEIAFGLTQMGFDEVQVTAQVSDILSQFGKSHWADASIHTLSQGQKHLVCLMSVAAMAPKVLILDEPFAGLDIPTKMQLTRALDGFDGTLIHISHDPRDLAGYDTVYWLEGGSIRDQGATDQVLAAFEAEMIAAGAGDDLSDLAG